MIDFAAERRWPLVRESAKGLCDSKRLVCGGKVNDSFDPDRCDGCGIQAIFGSWAPRFTLARSSGDRVVRENILKLARFIGFRMEISILNRRTGKRDSSRQAEYCPDLHGSAGGAFGCRHTLSGIRVRWIVPES